MTARYSIVTGDPVADRLEMLELATRNRPGPRSRIEAKYEKYYENNPLGSPWLFLARDNETGGLVGMTALFPTTLWVAGAPVPAIGADFAVDAGHRGFGPAVALPRATVTAVSDHGLSCAYGSPNSSSEPIVGRAGYADVGRLTRFVKLLTARPLVDRYVSRPALASLASTVASPFASTLSRKRLRRRSPRLSVDEPEAFDERFASLWEVARRQLPITSERHADLLNWRYEKTGPAERRRTYSIFALVDGGDVAGYVVYRTDDDARLVYDIVCLPEKPMVDALLGEFILDARRNKADAIDIGYVGPANLLIARLRAFGFIERPAQNGLRVCAAADATPGVNLTHRQNWYFMTGDTDF